MIMQILRMLDFQKKKYDYIMEIQTQIKKNIILTLDIFYNTNVIFICIYNVIIKVLTDL